MAAAESNVTLHVVGDKVLSATVNGKEVKQINFMGTMMRVELFCSLATKMKMLQHGDDYVSALCAILFITRYDNNGSEWAMDDDPVLWNAAVTAAMEDYPPPLNIQKQNAIFQLDDLPN